MELDVLVSIFVNYWQIIGLFFIVSVVYSSVGFGGGSSYLAILTLFALPFAEIRSIALVCNIVVVSGNVFLFSKEKLYQWKKILPLVLVSVPAAFLGGKLPIEKDFFFLLLAITLIIAASIMLYSSKLFDEKSKPASVSKNGTIGGIIGFISGMVGIGGGIFLAPFLHLTNWNSAKKIAAVSSLFILLNSISGLIGQSFNENFTFNPQLSISLAIVVFVGGQIGSRMNINFFSTKQVRNITAIVIFIAAFNILWNM